jgi:DNA-directed RNA polymerase subunit RPC12/RpoP
MVVHPNYLAVRLACYILILAWIELVAFGLFFLLSVIGIESLDNLTGLMLVSIIVTVCCYFLLALNLRCPACNRRFLLQTIGVKHPSARTILGMDHWASNVIDVVRTAELTCMYCGERYLV